MKRFLLCLPFWILFVAVSSAVSQGYRHPPNPYLEIERLENEIGDLISQQEKLVSEAEARNNQLRQLHNQRDRAKAANEKTKIDLDINALNNENRIASTTASRIAISIKRREFEIDRITRFIQFSNHTSPSTEGTNIPGKPPEIKSISVVRTATEGPVRIPGKGNGFYEVTIYEVAFVNGVTKRVEEKKLRPDR